MINQGNDSKGARAKFLANFYGLDKTQKISLLTIIILVQFVIPLSIVAVKHRVSLQSRASEVVTPPTPPNGGNHPPILTVTLRKVRVGVYFESNVVAKDKDADDTLTVTATNLPSGVQLTNCSDSNTRSGKMVVCKLAGSVSETGSYQFTIQVVDSGGLTYVKTVDLQVN